VWMRQTQTPSPAMFTFDILAGLVESMSACEKKAFGTMRGGVVWKL
jgi:hypothetical protein